MAKCEVCGNDYDGHGMEADGKFFCCATCASHAGNPQMRDRAESRQPLAGPG